jgi:hypothetical protein
MSAGFYKLEGNTLHYGPNYVRCLEYKLFKETKDDHTYPIDGWYWFDSQEEAHTHFGIVVVDQPVE